MREISKSEVLRYACCKQSDQATDALINECIGLVKDKIRPQYCFNVFNVNVKGQECNFESFLVKSQSLAKNLQNAKKVIVFAATLGFEFDRILAKYSKISPAKACVLQAIGVERIEAYADELCEHFKCTFGNVGTRFSAGYGDLSLEVQKDIFLVLDCTKKLGITLNQSLIMSPTKSITAFVGIFDNDVKTNNEKCKSCNKTDCAFRINF